MTRSWRSGSWRSRSWRSRSWRRAALLAALSPLLLAPLLLAHAARAGDGYRLGHGYDVGPFNFAGYVDVAASLPHGRQVAAALEDVSLFATGHVARLLNPFVETELTHLDLTPADPAGGERADGAIVLERLYNDAYLTDSLTLRLGKMLAPVGEWNQIHAAPLVLSATRPAVTYRNFSEYVTGGAVMYADPDGDLPEVQAYWQPDGELSERPGSVARYRYRAVRGLHVKLPLSLIDHAGASLQQSQDARGVRQSLAGADFQVTIDALTLQGEGTWSSLSGTSTRRRDEWGGYVAASYALGERWSAYGWLEAFAGRDGGGVARDALAGIAFRPLPPMVFKLEGVVNAGGDAVNPSGVFASWSVLF